MEFKEHTHTQTFTSNESPTREPLKLWHQTLLTHTHTRAHTHLCICIWKALASPFECM